MLYLLLSPPSAALNPLLFSDKEVERGCPMATGQPAGMRGKFVWENMGRQRTDQESEGAGLFADAERRGALCRAPEVRCTD